MEQPTWGQFTFNRVLDGFWGMVKQYNITLLGEP